MKTPLYTLTFCLILLLACKKKADLPSNSRRDPSTATTPSPTPITADLAVYAYGNNQAFNPLYMINYRNDSQRINYVPTFDAFFGNGLSLDKYLSHVKYSTSLTSSDPRFGQSKSFDLSGNAKNYVGVKLLPFANTGNVKNLGGPVTLTLPGGGILSLPSAVWSSLAIEMNYNVYVNYLDPTATEYVTSLPSLPFADLSGQRLFLESYGIYQIQPVLSYCNCNILTSFDLFSKNVTLQMPIPASRIASSPDSVAAWHLNSESLIWEKKGVAYKKNGFYQAQIGQYGAWNFAVPRDAVYLTLQLRTTNDIPLPNTRFVVKNNQDEVAEGRTDMEGNALVLVPATTDLSFNIINDHHYNWANIQLPDQAIGKFSRESTKKIMMPDRIDIGTLQGTVYNCDGSLFANGSVVISQINAKDNYIVPISNGKFTTANWLRSYGDAKLSFRDGSGNTAFEVNTFLGSRYMQLKRLQENFYACPDAAALYCNYQLDSAKNTISGNIGQASPVLVAKRIPGQTVITIQNGNKGISFSMWISSVPDGEIMPLQPLTIDNVPCRYNRNGIFELVIYRNDATVNKFMEGWFSIDYLDGANWPHKASGNFRVKIVN